jgi:hypothetical protein
MNRWKLYYADGSTYASEDGPAEQSPGWGVVVIACYESGQRRLIHGHGGRDFRDYYCFNPTLERWFEHDHFGLAHYLAQPGWKIVRFGCYVPDEAYRALMLTAMDDLLLEVQDGR